MVTLTATTTYLSDTSSGKSSAGKKEIVPGLESLSTKATPWKQRMQVSLSGFNVSGLKDLWEQQLQSCKPFDRLTCIEIQFSV